MMIATVGEIQKNFARISGSVRAGEEISLTRRGKPLARITALGPKSKIDWPDFYGESGESGGRQLPEIVLDRREERGY